MLALNEDEQLTVQDIMDRPAFRHAYLAAGAQGLRRQVRWVHIIEVIQFEELLQGGEMILTTGAAFKTDSGLFTAYIDQLVKRGVACLCIEMGHYITSVPEAWIDLAESHGLPLIIFPQAVRFIDITQDVHAQIINQHHHALQQLERISREFHRMTLTSQGVGQVLQLLQNSTGAQVVYLPSDNGQPHFVPHAAGPKAARWLELLEGRPLDSLQAGPSLLEADGQTVIIQPVGAMGKTWAHLVLAFRRKPRQQDYLILDSASLSIAQDLLRRRYIEERKLYSQTLWVDDLLHLRLRDEEQIKALVGTDFKRFNELTYRVCLIEFEHERGNGGGNRESSETGFASGFGEGDESFGIHLSLTVRSVFEQHAFLPLITLQNNRLVVIAFDQSPSKPAKERLRRVFGSLRELKSGEGGKPPVIGVGQPNRGFRQAYASYQEAIHAISLSSTLRESCLFFEELGVFRLLFHIADKQMLESFVRSCLGPLIDHDRARGSELLRTLKVYLDHDGSKQIAAQRLFIVRQSLYYRLDQIEELLGADYMEPEKRLSLQVAIRAYQLLNPDQKLV
ncbi:PucR family transcriptional regulator ligand-binding domain-containing protein [Paenibacillus sp. LHD-117]|uniref:PucR family transcriptional regulator n=1 Tax=Paenibacillus sp. LHD-117 TaxID=3071412 RepID=UPI0027DF537F|nr:PucR family transcriptional regulator ligand-binding domain-containing protein [Paenibacillus sp. LHD-117]MDQ6422401.1 PucR family transcriptional regulator ligand-binding domain-containing protein [Paenibacillus sp. LHD-117]